MLYETRPNNSPWSWDGSFVHWHFCRGRFCVGTTTTNPLWLSFLPPKCLGWRISGWWSRSCRGSSSSFRRRFLRRRWTPVWHPFFRWTQGLCWRWRSAKDIVLTEGFNGAQTSNLPCGNASCRDRALGGSLQKWLPTRAWVWVRYGSHLRYSRWLFRLCVNDCCTMQWRSMEGTNR